MIKKAQITLFIIVSLALIISLGLIYAFQLGETDKAKETAETALRANSGDVQLFVEDCLKQVASDGLLLIGVQGGYAQSHFIPLYTFSSDIGYAYYEGVNIVPSLQFLGRELSTFVEKQLPACTKNFEEFKQLGYAISGKKPKAETIFTEDSTVVNLDWPLQVKKAASTTVISDFSVEILVRLKKIHEVMETLVENQEEKPEFIDYGYLKTTEFVTVLQPMNDDIIVYAVIDNQSMLFNSPYTFLFANKFKFSNFSIGYRPVLGYLPETNATIGEEFTYEVKATDIDSEKLSFSSSSKMISINQETGLVNFTPTIEQAGMHFAVIEVKDEKGLKDSQLMAIEVA